jgi:dihydroorotate dehydrogenase
VISPEDSAVLSTQPEKLSAIINEIKADKTPIFFKISPDIINVLKI